jgi:D-alanyl-lipoteichoic acid acyltransferase DltB (MBOAT superfamily)
MLLLALCTGLDYLYGFGVASGNRNKAKFFLWLSIVNNLGILAVFKYYNFFALQLKSGFEQLGLNLNPVLLNVALPVGVSFYTFHGMSYVFDIYRGKTKPVTSIVDYGVFVAFFPLLVAGPIERASHLLPQIQKPRSFDYGQAVGGCRLILWGLFKKIVIADSLAPLVDKSFYNYSGNDSFTLIIGAIAFSFQIYGDFSGYSDIAIGVSKLLGFELFSNFKFPYFSRDIAEFWRRWHVSLSSWFRDYVYVPLGGSREGIIKAVRNTFIIFLLSGFWHGASWNFLVWGGIHAFLFLPLLLTGRNRYHIKTVVAHDRILPNLKELFQMATTFFFVTLAWVFFRSEDLKASIGYFERVIVNGIQEPEQFLHPFRYLSFGGTDHSIYLTIVLIALDWRFRRNERDIRFSGSRAVNWVFIMVLSLMILNYILAQSDGKPRSFIYFEF